MSSVTSPTPTTRVSEMDFDMDVEVDTSASTAVPSSPLPSVGDNLSKKTRGIIEDIAVDASKRVEKEHEAERNEPDLRERLERLNILLEKSTVYTSLLGARMNQTTQLQQSQDTTASKVTQASVSRSQKGRSRKSRSAADSLKAKTGSKRTRQEATEDDDEGDENVKRLKLEDGGAATHENPDSLLGFKQPEAITGAKLKDYQLVGVQWLTSLWANGVNGILADEMGLGKTLQTIAFLANLRQVSIVKPVLIVCPLSVLHNWVDEFEKFAPSIPVCMYHGTPAERAELRRTKMVWHEDDPSLKKDSSRVLAVPNNTKDTSTKRSTRSGKNSLRKSKHQSSPSKEQTSRRSTRLKTSISRRSKSDERSSEVDDEGKGDEESYIPNDVIDAETDEDVTLADNETIEDDSVADGAQNSTDSQRTNDTFPIILTTYEMIIKDRQHLSKYDWNFIIVDEGHRLKNMDCKLMQEIKKYHSANRLILTGTPLHNNLAELWSLLNFILPDIFTDLDSFQEWFNLPTLQNALPNEQSTHLISKLHGILKPFLLRRLKADVELSLPPKKEYVLYAPLSESQREIYNAVVTGVLRSYLINGKQGGDINKDQVKGGVKGRRLRKRVSYNVDGEDDEWFDKLENGELSAQLAYEEQLAISRELQSKHAIRQVNSMKLQNTVMQLRKVCSHPFLFSWPSDPVTRELVVNEELVNASGKMMILDRLLSELFDRGHKVLLFSQFTTMLDIIEEWADSFKSWPTCRIDGSTGPMERRAEMNRFQNPEEGSESPRLFLLSTRAGGLGINLTAADTVIFYDQDWNPQMDIQAQARAHRIGQTKPVLIFRLVSAHTVETKIMQRANEKRQLEALVIAKGKFRMPGSTARGKGESIAETAASLLKLEGEKIEIVSSSEVGKAKIISDSDLEKLLDRSPEVFADRGKGWTSGAKAVEGGTSDTGDVAFEVFQAPVDQCNDRLAAMMGEKME